MFARNTANYLRLNSPKRADYPSICLSKPRFLMRTRRTISCLMLAVYAVGLATPAYADPIETRHITQVVTQAQNVPDIRLRGLYTGDLPRNEFPLPATVRNEASLPSLETTVGMDLSILTLQEPQKGTGGATVETAICDCADLMVPVVGGGGFPKWPLLFLAGIPLIFLKGGEDQLPPIVTPTPPPPTPSPTQTTIPEPASLLLLLSGVGALGMRLRRSRNRDEKTDDV